VLSADDRDRLAELAPLLRRAATLDPRGVARLRADDRLVTVLVRLPFAVLVSRTVEVSTARSEPLDLTVRATELIAWFDGEAGPPAPRDSEWRSGLPPARGWQRLDTVPDDVVRDLVRRGAETLRDAAVREGVPGAQPRAAVADALLDSTVLTVTDEADHSAEVTLRALSALTRMGFLPRGGPAHVDVAGRWVRVVGEYGTVHLERPGAGLQLR
jgi:hypothetical protein